MSKPVGPYTPVVRAGDWLVISGQVGAIDGKLVDGGMGGQLEQVLTKMDTCQQRLAKVAALLKRFRQFGPCRGVFGTADGRLASPQHAVQYGALQGAFATDSSFTSDIAHFMRVNVSGSFTPSMVSSIASPTCRPVPSTLWPSIGPVVSANASPTTFPSTMFADCFPTVSRPVMRCPWT